MHARIVHTAGRAGGEKRGRDETSGNGGENSYNNTVLYVREGWREGGSEGDVEQMGVQHTVLAIAAPHVCARVCGAWCACEQA